MTADSERGTVEVLPLAMLTFVAGALLLSHAWAVVAARNEAAAAARAGVVAHVESRSARPDLEALAAANRTIGDSAFRWHIAVSGRPGRCRPVTVRVSGAVPLLRLPWIGASASVPVEAAHSQIVDPYRSGLEGTAACHG